MDELADFTPQLTPYHMGMNNPGNYVDPWGLFATRDEARDYARQNGIKTGLFRQKKIREQKDGSFAIVNNNAHTETFRDQQSGEVFTSAVIKEGAPSQAFTNSISVSGALFGGFGLELGYAQDNYSQGGLFFRFSGEIGFGGGIGASHQVLVPTGDAITLDDIKGKDVEYNLDLAIIGIQYGGDQSKRPSGAKVFVEFGRNYIVEGMSLDSEDIITKNWKVNPSKFSAGARVSFGQTWFLFKEKNSNKDE